MDGDSLLVTDVNRKLDLGERNGYTFMLHLAVDVALDSYEPNTVECILSLGANCNKMDGKGFAPLHYAVLRSNTAAAQALIKAGADVNLQVGPESKGSEWMPKQYNGRGEFNTMTALPLHMATTTQVPLHKTPSFPFSPPLYVVEGFYGPRNLDLIKLLLSSGANCNVLDEQGLAHLHYAVWADDVSAADILLESGADININTRDEKVTPLFCVVSKKMLLFLLSKKPVFNGNTVLLHFINTRKHKLSLTLLSDLSVTDVPESDITSPLSCAFRQRNEISIKLLINSGYDPRQEVLTLQEQLSKLGMHCSEDRNGFTPRNHSPEDEQLIEEMRLIISNPRRLFDLCRFKIRNILKTNIRMAVLDLPLPKKLREAICLKDVAQYLKLVDQIVTTDDDITFPR